MHKNFEATGNLDEWPRNEPGKPTQAAVFGMCHPKRGKVCEILWTGKFPDLEPAMYWAAKKELEAVRKGKWMMASRVLWQHELTPEQAVETIRVRMAPQVDQAIKQMRAGCAEDEIDIGTGPMRKVQPGQAQGYYAEMVPRDDDGTAEPLARMWLPGDPRGGGGGEGRVEPQIRAGVQLTLDVMRETYTICKLPHDADVPAWTAGGDGGAELEFCAIVRTREELAVVRRQRDVPDDVATRNDGWRGLKVRGPIDLNQSGILVMVLLALASGQVPAFPVATYDTDYVFVPAGALDRAIESLQMVGHTVHA